MGKTPFHQSKPKNGTTDVPILELSQSPLTKNFLFAHLPEKGVVQCLFPLPAAYNQAAGKVTFPF